VDVETCCDDILRVFLRHAIGGSMIGFESDPSNHTFLTSRFPSTQFEQVTLSDTDETPGLFVTSQPARNHLVDHIERNIQSDGPDENIKVRVTALDRFFATDKEIYFIKIDAEGAELKILERGLKALRRSQPFMVIEHGFIATAPH
jgi:FkbM family methyltransferase